MKKILLYLFILISLICLGEATHFRFGTISYQPVGSYNVIKFSSNFGFRIEFFSGLMNRIDIGTTVNVGTLKFGSGSDVSVIVTVNSFDKTENWFTGDFSVTRTYPTTTTEKDYLVVFTSCCRLSSLINNANGNWYITTKVRLQPNTPFESLNISPVSGMVPIINVINKRINKFKVVANDPNGDSDQLTFSTEVLPSASLTQPSGLTIAPTTGIVTFTPTQQGLYSTQIVIKDPQVPTTYIVVDFLLKSEDKTGFCHNTCGNKANTVCKYNTDCGSCTGTDNDGNTCTTSVPTFVYPPTPADGEVKYIDIGKSSTFSFQCTSPDTTKTVHIQTANLPSGITQTKNIQDQNTATLEWSMTGTTSNVGSYVLSAVCTDSGGVSSTVTSFTISIKKPICGNGVTSGVNQCTCNNEGWDPSSNCFQCSENYFGPECIKAPACENGAVNDGTEGDGTCSCFYGWKGEHCDISTADFCKPGAPNSVSSFSNSDPSYINPTFSQVYINTNPSTAAADLGLKLSIPSNLENLNILVVVDSAPSKDIYWKSVSNYMSSFISRINTLCESPSLGLGLFSDAATGGYNFQLSRVIGDNIDVLGKSVNYDVISTTSTQNTVAALNAAALYPSGWTKGAIRIIVLLTDKDRKTESDATLFSNLEAQSIIPVVIGLDNPVSTWNTSFATKGYGYAESSSIPTASSVDWVNKAFNGISTVLSKAVLKVVSDPDKFITLPTASVNTNIAKKQDTMASLPVSMKYPTTAVSNLYPEATVSVIGFGTSRVIVNYNHPPTTSTLYINAKQNTPITFTFPANDIDGNKLNVLISTLPSSATGTIKIGSSTGSNAVVNQAYEIAKTIFVFVPTTNYFNQNSVDFSFSVSDGCDSASGTAKITVEHVNQAPTCPTTPISVTSKLNSEISFQLKGSDIDANELLYVVFSDLSPISGRGTIKSNSANVVVNNQYQLTSSTPSTDYVGSFTFTQSYNPDKLTTYQINYKLRDKGGLEAQCALSFNLQHSNVAPTIISPSTAAINQNGNLRIDLLAIDTDSTAVKFTVTRFSTSTDSFFYACDDENKNPITSLTTALITLDQSSKANYSNLCYHAPLENTSSDSVTFTATDDDKVEPKTSAPFTITINVVGSRDNVAPVAIQIPNFSVNEDGISTQFAIDGTDVDELDQGNLIGIIKTQPLFGKLVITKNNQASVSGKAPYKLMYQPNLLYHGSDSFSYAVQDTLGAESKVLSTTITVVHVNHPPALTIQPHTFKSSDEQPVVLTLSPTDVDNDNPVFTCTITALPKSALIFKSNGEQITKVPTALLSDNKYYFKSDGKTYQGFTDSFKAICSDNFVPVPGISPEATGSIIFQYINTAPNAQSSRYQLVQNQEKFSFTIIGNDIETPNSLQAYINILPLKGKLLDKDGKDVVISQKTPYGLSDLTYTPNKGISDWDMPGNVGPSDQFTFSITDGDLTSAPSISYFLIEPRNPPTYNGISILSTKENENLSFTIDGVVGGGGKNVYLELQEIKSNGTLYDVVCMGSEGCIAHDQSSPKTIYRDSDNNKYNFMFVPVIYENGDNYATIKFRLYDVYGANEQIYSSSYTIIINVTPVNQAPVIELISYTVDGVETLFGSSLDVFMLLNTSVIIKYDASDIDNPKKELQSFISGPITRGIVHNYNKETESLGEEINFSTSPINDISSDGYWYIHYTHNPNLNTTVNKYTNIPISVRDPFAAVATSRVNINVYVNNVGPYITTDESKFNTTGSTRNPMRIYGLSYVDPDSKTVGTNQIVLSIVGKDSDEPVSIDDMEFSLDYNTSCVFSTSVASVTCTNTQKLLESSLSSININPKKQGVYRIKLFVDDLGYNAPEKIRDQNHLNATAYYEISISPGGSDDKDNKTVLTAAIAASAGGAAIIAAAIWQVLRRSAPPTDAFFGDAPFMEGAVASNPLYEQSANSSVNPLYNDPEEAF
ncbi:hypothetical protein DICPUDRAFT_81870 [Dictyostelium purpureum]|uniref:VWFA domain-containing protein n=1 Tax=Dictyostelium purpureum TaxID=5786 RepID=F0ZUU4_DICPU|nr:uncharacterized protein DICPUDRAFT_81870 [Dictyostelium purpureum]EGC32283.1 hypothetical protein DICPUDRAFT_81870 [Dictyostelium purpureum]|eukprot:XP_003291192.1 hypothetical protein DICPUDRAFT_81870 [Dictyostelium purpureum]